MSEALYCSNCGRINERNDPFCASCGYKFPADVLVSYQKSSSIPITDHDQLTKKEEPVSTKDFIKNPPFGFLLIASFLLLLLCTAIGFIASAIMFFEVIGFIIFGGVSAVLASCCGFYLLYCIFSKNYLIRKMNDKIQLDSYQDILEKNLDLLFSQGLFQGTIIKAIFRVLTILYFVGFVSSFIGAIVFYFVVFGGLFYYFY